MIPLLLESLEEGKTLGERKHSDFIVRLEGNGVPSAGAEWFGNQRFLETEIELRGFGRYMSCAS